MCRASRTEATLSCRPGSGTSPTGGSFGSGEPSGSEEPAGSREALRDTAPALELADDTDPNGSVLTNARAFEPAAAGSQADSLPFTGSSLAFLGFGLALFAAGFAVRFAIVPRGALA